MSNDKNNVTRHDHAPRTPAPTPTSVKEHMPNSPKPEQTDASKQGGKDKR